MGLFSGFRDFVSNFVPNEIKDVISSDAGRIATGTAGFGVGGTTGANLAGGLDIPLQDTFFLDLAGLGAGGSLAGAFAGGSSLAPWPGGGMGGGGGPIAAGTSFGSGLLGLLESRRMRSLAEQAMNAQPQVIDPMGYGPRAGFLEQLNALMRDPSLIEKLPGYAAGLKGVERTMASQGYTGSGNMAIKAAEYGRGAFDSEIGRLAALAGVGQPLSVSRPDTGAAVQAGRSASDLLSRAMASFGYGARQMGW